MGPFSFSIKLYPSDASTEGHPFDTSNCASRICTIIGSIFDVASFGLSSFGIRMTMVGTVTRRSAAGIDSRQALIFSPKTAGREPPVVSRIVKVPATVGGVRELVYAEEGVWFGGRGEEGGRWGEYM